MDIWRTHFLKILRIRKDFFRTIYHFCAFWLTPFPGVLMDVRQKKQDRIPRNSWRPPSQPGSRSRYWPGWQTQGSREKEISSHVNSKVFALWLAKYTFCPVEDSVSSLPSRLTSGPVNTSFYSLSKLSVHIPEGLASFWKLYHPWPEQHVGPTQQFALLSPADNEKMQKQKKGKMWHHWKKLQSLGTV